jgi:hypothetical protein
MYNLSFTTMPTEKMLKENYLQLLLNNIHKHILNQFLLVYLPNQNINLNIIKIKKTYGFENHIFIIIFKFKP